MAWPDSKAIWGSALAGAQANIALVARTIANYEPVIICANPVSVAEARAACDSGVQVIGEIPVNDCWMRDTGPIFRVNAAGSLDAIGLNFNGWGHKQTHAKDALVARRVAAYVGAPFTRAGFVSEGGAIETDGHGTLLATRSSIINHNRNPGKVRVVAFHGTRDRVNPYGGGRTARWSESVPDAASAWARANDHAPDPVRTDLTPAVTRLSYGPRGDPGAVTLWVCDGAGHTWPGTRLTLWLRLLLGKVSYDVDATAEIWRALGGA